MEEYISRKAVMKAYEEEQRRPGPWRFETLINSVTAADVAPVIHAKRIKTKKHRWKTQKNGEIDFMAWCDDYCNGPICIDCGDAFCVNCERKYGGEEAVKNRLEEEKCFQKTVCSVCGRYVPEDAPYCHCGAKMDLTDD